MSNAQQPNPVVAELQSIVVFQAAQITNLSVQLRAHQEALEQTRQVLQHSEHLSAQRQRTIEEFQRQQPGDAPAPELVDA